MDLIKNFDIKIIDSLFNPQEIESKTVYISKRPDIKTRFKVWIYLEGSSLSFVDQAEYTLHSSFKNRLKNIERDINNQNCQFCIWTWGIFTLKVKLRLKTGDFVRLEHKLTFNDLLKNKSYIKDIKFHNVTQPVG